MWLTNVSLSISTAFSLLGAIDWTNSSDHLSNSTGACVVQGKTTEPGFLFFSLWCADSLCHRRVFLGGTNQFLNSGSFNH